MPSFEVTALMASVIVSLCGHDSAARGFGCLCTVVFGAVVAVELVVGALVSG